MLIFLYNGRKWWRVICLYSCYSECAPLVCAFCHVLLQYHHNLDSTIFCNQYIQINERQSIHCGAPERFKNYVMSYSNWNSTWKVKQCPLTLSDSLQRDLFSTKTILLKNKTNRLDVLISKETSLGCVSLEYHLRKKKIQQTFYQR